MQNNLTLKSLFDSLDENELEPNQLYLLFCIKERKESKINVFQPLRALLDKKLISSQEVVNQGYLLEQYLVTPEGAAILETVGYTSTKEPVIDSKMDLSTITQQYNDMFPKMKAGSGSYMRSNPKDVKDALKWFITNYKYPWDIILKATARYLDDEELKSFKYTSTSRYFIKKMDVSRTVTSKLADWCEIVQNGEEIVERPNFSDKVV
jgi:hypothetical protein